MTPIRVTAPELVLLGEPISVAVEIEPDAKQRVPGVEIELIADRPTGGAQPDRRLPVIRDGRAEATFSPREPGVYSIRVHGAAPGSPVTPITATVLVWAGDRP